MKTHKVVLIDDDSSINFLHQILLEKSGQYTVVETFLMADKALEYFQSPDRPEIDLILLDINMPKMNGWEFIEDYKKLPAELKAGVTVMMLTTSVNPEHMTLAEEDLEIKGMIHKPLKVETLSALLEKA